MSDIVHGIVLRCSLRILFPPLSLLLLTSKYFHSSRLEDPTQSRSIFQGSVHNTFQINANAKAYDKSLLQKLDNSRRGSDQSVRGPDTPPHTRQPFSSSENEASPTSRATSDRQYSYIKPLSVPTAMSKSSNSESPLSRWARVPAPPLSPRHLYSYDQDSHRGLRSPVEPLESERPSFYDSRHPGSGLTLSLGDENASLTSLPIRPAYDTSVFGDTDPDFPMEETNGLRRLNLGDRSPLGSEAISPGMALGRKRRASSPPREDGHVLRSMSSMGDLQSRRASNLLSAHAYRTHSNHGSVSSTSSAFRNGSYASTLSSTLSLGASSMTSMSSYDRLSPGGMSPGRISPSAEFGGDSSFINLTNRSPRGSISRIQHQRTLSESRPLTTARKLSDVSNGHSKHHSVPKVAGVYICQCCPKKPKKFDTSEELT